MKFWAGNDFRNQKISKNRAKYRVKKDARMAPRIITLIARRY